MGKRLETNGMQEGEGEGKVKGEGDPHRRDAADPAGVGGGVCGGAREESREGAEESRGEASRVGSRITQGEEGVSRIWLRVHVAIC